jgi:hypothetical protein
MMAVNHVSQSIISRMRAENTKQEVCVDPTTLQIIISTIVVQIIKLLAEYLNYKKQDGEQEEVAYNILKSPNFLQRRILKRTIRKEMGFWQYWVNGGKVYDSLLQEGQQADVEIVKDLFNEVIT